MINIYFATYCIDYEEMYEKGFDFTKTRDRFKGLPESEVLK